jgi:SAM-dependent methyltransferase
MPKMYESLASWWPLLSAPADYEEEAAFFADALTGTAGRPRTVLELGSGGGNNASHLKARFEMVLVEPSEGMRAVSRALNPECEHVDGDMRDVRLGRQFDAVFVHDAVCYMTTESDLRKAIDTAFIHCRPGGAALFAPDFVRENFRQSTDHGGHDREGCGTWNGRAIPILPTPPTLSTTPTCCARPMAVCMSNTTGTSRVCSAERHGCACCRMQGSSRAPSHSSILSSNPDRTRCS